MLFVIKGESSPVIQEFGARLVDSLDLPHPEWPLGDEEEQQSWEAALEGLPVGDFADNFDVPFVDVDRIAGLVFFRTRKDVPLAPDWKEQVAERGFWPWMSDQMREMLGPKYLPQVFELTCQMIDSVDHAVVLGGALGLSPANSRLAQMILFKYSSRPTLKVFVKRGASADGVEASEGDIVLRAVIGGKEWKLSEALSRLQPTPDGQFAFNADA